MHKMVADKKWVWASEVARLQSQTLCRCESGDTVYHNSVQAYLELPNPKDDNSMSVKQCMLIRYSRVCHFAQDSCAGFSKLALLLVPHSLSVVVIVSKPSPWGRTPQSCWKNNSTTWARCALGMESLLWMRLQLCVGCKTIMFIWKQEWVNVCTIYSFPTLHMNACYYPFVSYVSVSFLSKRWGSIIKPVLLDVR